MAGPDEREADNGVPDQDNKSPDNGRDSPGNDPGPSQDDRRAHFISLLSDDDEVSRWKAAEALGRMEDPEAVEELISSLWDDDARVRLKAAWALGRIGDMRAYAPLQRLYRMENEEAQEIIAEALENIRRGMSRQ
jgi:HEAT repeat protein